MSKLDEIGAELRKASSDSWAYMREANDLRTKAHGLDQLAREADERADQLAKDLQKEAHNPTEQEPAS